jgi:hypothetical protein
LRKRKKYRKKLKKHHLLDNLYHHWLQTEVQDVHLYMSDYHQVNTSNDTQYGLQTEVQDSHLYTSDSQLHAPYHKIGGGVQRQPSVSLIQYISVKRYFAIGCQVFVVSPMLTYKGFSTRMTWKLPLVCLSVGQTTCLLGEK